MLENQQTANSFPLSSPQLSTTKTYSPSATNKLEKRLRNQTARAILEYGMINNKDHVMVCVSGGKDSFTLLALLLQLQRIAPIEFSITAVHLEQGHPGFPVKTLEDQLKKFSSPYHIVSQDTYSIVKKHIAPGKTQCSLCSRLRRGALYTIAKRIQANVVALGHHRDDIVETFFMNMFHGSRLKAMPAKLLSDDGHHTLIRPLAYCNEKEITSYAQRRAFAIIPCDLCGSQENLERKKIKKMLQAMENEHPGRIENIFRSLSRISPSHLLDPGMFDFHSLKTTKVPLAVSE